MALAGLISDECATKEDVLIGAVLFSALDSSPSDVELPRTAIQANFVDDGMVIVTIEPQADPILVQGTPISFDPDDGVPLELIKEDGVWRLLNCETIVYELG